MSVTVLGLIGTGISALVGVGSWVYSIYRARKAAENTPAMQANTQAAVDLKIEQEAEVAVTASDKGDLSQERKGDAE